MKKILSTLLVFTLLQLHAIAAVIPEGTIISVQPKRLIDADKVTEGAPVYFETTYPVKVNGKTVIKPGTEVSARVIKRKNNFILGIPGELEIGNFELRTSNSDVIPLKGTVLNEGEGRYWAHVGWFFLFPLLFIKGNDGKIPVSYSVNLYTIEDSNY